MMASKCWRRLHPRASRPAGYRSECHQPQLPSGGTLLASQRWRRVDGRWRLATHRYIPWSADGATAVATLRCDRRGCVLLGREINTREVVQRGAVLMDKFG